MKNSHSKNRISSKILINMKNQRLRQKLDVTQTKYDTRIQTLTLTPNPNT